MMEPEASLGNILLTIKCIKSRTLVLINPYSKWKCDPIIDKDLNEIVGDYKEC